MFDQETNIQSSPIFEDRQEEYISQEPPSRCGVPDVCAQAESVPLGLVTKIVWFPSSPSSRDCHEDGL